VRRQLRRSELVATTDVPGLLCLEIDGLAPTFCGARRRRAGARTAAGCCTPTGQAMPFVLFPRPDGPVVGAPAVHEIMRDWPARLGQDAYRDEPVTRPE
jgi:hypothetical protein